MVDNSGAKSHHVGTPNPTFSVERTFPYNLWVIKPSRGRLPDHLKGTYTETHRAIEDIENEYDEPTIKVRY